MNIAHSACINIMYSRIEAVTWNKFFSHKINTPKNCSQTNASSGNMYVDSIVLNILPHNFVNSSHVANILSQRGKFKSIYKYSRLRYSKS